MAEYTRDPEAIAQLTPEQFAVTQQAATEAPFDNEFWDNEDPGLYVDVVSGEPLFASTTQYDSGCGWPSFTAPLTPENIIENSDVSLGVERTELRSAGANSHLGHVFDEGPIEEGGLRSASTPPRSASSRSTNSPTPGTASSSRSSTRYSGNLRAVRRARVCSRIDT